jgi:riboflavin-specific deaminase-like protein
MYICSNLAISLDGKIATHDRAFFTLGSAQDLRLLRKLRNQADVIFFGSGVLRAFRRACLPLRSNKKTVNAVVSRNFSNVDPSWPFFLDPRIDRILYVSGKITPALRSRFGKSSELVQIRQKRLVDDVLADLKKRGFTRLGVEGGGDLMWPFVEANAIDEYYVTLTPKLVGGRDAPTLVDGKGFSPNQVRKLRLKSLRRFGDEIYLVYTK